MLKLYGVEISNYFGTARAALLAKDLPFEIVTTMPGDKPEVLAGSPMGKVPYIETEHGCLSETNVIFDYLEDLKPSPAMYPADPWQRAKAREIMRVIELYLDAPARRHLPTVYFGAPVDEQAKQEVRPLLEKGLQAFSRLARLDGFLAGEAPGFVDVDAWFQLAFTRLHTRKIYDWDIVDDLPGLAAYLDRVRTMPAVDEAASAMEAALEGFLPK